MLAGLFVLWFARELRKIKFISLYQSPMVSQNLVGATGVVSTDLSPTGEVMVNGEFWTGELEIETADVIAAGTDVEVVSIDGNHLKVKPMATDSSMSDVSSSE